jgi:hypothetical protein
MAIAMFVDWPWICVVLAYIRTRSQIVQSGIVSGIQGSRVYERACLALLRRSKQRSNSEKCGLEGVAIQWRCRGRPTTKRARNDLQTFVCEFNSMSIHERLFMKEVDMGWTTLLCERRAESGDVESRERIWSKNSRLSRLNLDIFGIMYLNIVEIF